MAAQHAAHQLATAAQIGMIVVAEEEFLDDATSLQVGRAWQRLHLAATELGLACQPMNQIPERIGRERQLGTAIQNAPRRRAGVRTRWHASRVLLPDGISDAGGAAFAAAKARDGDARPFNASRFSPMRRAAPARLSDSRLRCPEGSPPSASPHPDRASRPFAGRRASGACRIAKRPTAAKPKKRLTRSRICGARCWISIAAGPSTRSTSVPAPAFARRACAAIAS